VWVAASLAESPIENPIWEIPLTRDVVGSKAPEKPITPSQLLPTVRTRSFPAVHPDGLAVDSRGDIYVGAVSWTASPQIYPGKPHPANLRSLQKFEKVE
jgi:hypothetical protein